MGRTNIGTVKQKDGLFYPRVRWTTVEGKPRDYKLRPVRSERLAWKAVDKKLEELQTNGSASVDAERMKFSQLADAYREARLFAAVIVNGKKVAGVKSLSSLLCYWKVLADYFGKMKLRDIGYEHLETFKRERLGTPTIHGTQRQISSVNRELQLARAMFNFAIERRWLTLSPFVGIASETVRDRKLTQDERLRLIAECRKPNKYGRYCRLQLIPLLIASWHTAARRKELISLTWREVDFAAGKNGTITVTSGKSKTELARTIPLSLILREQLLELWENSAKDPDELVFGYKSTPKVAFMAACKAAGITNYTWHDNRHTGTTMMMDSIKNGHLVMKVTGHTQEKTFRRYYNPGLEELSTVTEGLE